MLARASSLTWLSIPAKLAYEEASGVGQRTFRYVPDGEPKKDEFSVLTLDEELRPLVINASGHALLLKGNIMTRQELDHIRLTRKVIKAFDENNENDNVPKAPPNEAEGSLDASETHVEKPSVTSPPGMEDGGDGGSVSTTEAASRPSALSMNAAPKRGRKRKGQLKLITAKDTTHNSVPTYLVEYVEIDDEITTAENPPKKKKSERRFEST